MINTAVLEPRKWLELLERMSIFGLLMHAIPPVPSMQLRVGRARGEGALERKGWLHRGNMVSVSTIQMPTAYVIFGFKTLASCLWQGRNGMPGPIGQRQDAGAHLRS